VSGSSYIKGAGH